MKQNFKIKLLTSVLALEIILLNLEHVPLNNVYAKKISNGDRLEQLVELQNEMYSESIEVKQTKEYQALIDKENLSRVVETKDKDGEILYEDYYSGSYVNGDGNLVILLNDADDEEKKEIEDAVSESVVIKSVRRPYQELKDNNSKFTDLLEMYTEEKNNNKINSDELIDLLDNITAFYIDIENNINVVSLQDASKESIEQFNNYFENDQNVRFVEEERPQMIATGIKAGRRIYSCNNSSSTGYSAYSVGSRASYVNSSGETVKGFLTCAHANNAVNDKIYINPSYTTEIGKITKRKYNGKVDAAFVKITNSNYTASRKVYYSDSAGTISDKFTLCNTCETVGNCVGETFYKAGSTTYITKGKVEAEGVTVTYTDGTTFKDLWQVNINVQKGDSGGVVFDTEECVSGIVQGGNSTYMYAINIDNIDNSFGTFVY